MYYEYIIDNNSKPYEKDKLHTGPYFAFKTMLRIESIYTVFKTLRVTLHLKIGEKLKSVIEKTRHTTVTQPYYS